jgi:hypothetical protein
MSRISISDLSDIVPSPGQKRDRNVNKKAAISSNHTTQLWRFSGEQAETPCNLYGFSISSSLVFHILAVLYHYEVFVQDRLANGGIR